MSKFSNKPFVDRTTESLDLRIYSDWKQGWKRRRLLACFTGVLAFTPTYFYLRHLNIGLSQCVVVSAFCSIVSIILLRPFFASKYTCWRCGSRLSEYQCLVLAGDRTIYKLTEGKLPINFGEKYSRVLECRKCTKFCFVETFPFQ